MAQRSAQQFAAVPVKYAITTLGGGVTGQGLPYPGGLDLTTPSLRLQAGALRDCLNFEVGQSGGYTRIQGYERLDGRPKPSAAGYTIVQVDAFTNLPAVGDSTTQAGSGATGVVAAVNNVAGAYYMVMTKVVGVFNFTGAITVGATPIGTAINQTVQISTLQAAQYLNAAADIYRADIGAVPGSGNILGVVGMIFNDVDNVYAFRADEFGVFVRMYKSTAAGWVLVPFFDTVQFTAGGVSEPVDGETLTQGGVTATIKRTQTSSGTYAGSTAAGQLVITDVAGGNFAAGAATTTSGTTLTLSGAEAAITLLTGGRFQFSKANFSGQLSTRRIYGCDNINDAFEFDGETFAPIEAGLPGPPSNVRCHKNMLFLSYASSVIHSGIGTPFRFLVVDGGGEIATGDVVTNLLPLPGNQTTAALGVYLRSGSSILYGTDPATFNFVTINDTSGALPYSAQDLFDAFVFDDIGVVTARTTLNYGNFESTSLTKNIIPFIVQQRNFMCASSVNHSKSQYRSWFSSGYGLWLTVVNQQFLGAALVYLPSPVFCTDDTDLTDGGMTSYYGSSNGDGFVYELDRGTSFDGDNIDAYIVMAWDPIKSPRILKRFRAASIEMQGDAYAAISFGYQLAYGSPDVGQPANTNYASGFSGPPVWDSTSMVWDNFVWDGRTLMPTNVDMTGTAENVQFILSSTTDYIASFNINSIITHFTPRRGMRA